MFLWSGLGTSNIYFLTDYLVSLRFSHELILMQVIQFNSGRETISWKHESTFCSIELNYFLLFRVTQKVNTFGGLKPVFH